MEKDNNSYCRSMQSSSSSSLSSGLSILSEIEAILVCKGCQCPYDNPVQIFKCGHNSCTKCLDSRKCPVCHCRISPKDTARNLFIANLLPNLKIIKQYLSATDRNESPDDDDETYVSQEDKLLADVSVAEVDIREASLQEFNKHLPSAAGLLEDSPTEYDDQQSEETRFTPDGEDTYIQSPEILPHCVNASTLISSQQEFLCTHDLEGKSPEESFKQSNLLFSQSMASWGKEVIKIYNKKYEILYISINKSS